MGKGERLWTKGFVLLCLVNFASWLSFNMVMPIMVKYVDSLGIPLSLGGIITGLFAFAALFSRPFSGILVDKADRKKIVIFSTLLMGMALYAYSVASGAIGIILFRIMHGLAFGVSTSASLVAVGDSVPEKRLNKALTYFGMTSILSMAIGPGIGIWISNTFGFALCFRIGALCLATAAAIMVFYPRNENEKVQASGEKRGSAGGRSGVGALIETKVLGLCLINLVFTLFVGEINAFLSIFGKTIGIENVSMHFTVSAIVIIMSRFFLARDDSIPSLARKLTWGFFCAALSLVIIALADNLFWLVLAGGVKAIAQGVGQPVLQILTFHSVRNERRGRAGSTLYIGGDLGQTLGPVMGGIAADAFGYRAMFLLTLIPLACGYLLHRRRVKANKY